MGSLRIGISTQTPLLKLNADATELRGRPSDQGLPNSENVPFELSPGGVSRMVYQTARAWLTDGWAKEIHWFSLQPLGARDIALEDFPITVHHLSLGTDGIAAYGRTKEKLWADIHGLRSTPFDVEDFRFYTRYNAFTSDAMLAQVPDLDVSYVHDFQLLQMGALVGLAAPCIMRWHVPFLPERIPPYTRNFILRLIEDFDALIVSTRRDQEGFKRAGYRGHLHQIYPHIDVADWPVPTSSTVGQAAAMYGIGSDEPVILLVGRMDPIKRHDLAIQALAKIHRKIPNAKLVLVGNGSFSSARAGGLGISKAEKWSAELVRLERELQLQDRIVHTHWAPHQTLAALYQRADCVVLPSDVEGFGITTLEAWRYEKPIIVSAGAGSSEIVESGRNGLVFPAGDVGGLADAIIHALSNKSSAEQMGSEGRQDLAAFEVSNRSRPVREAIEAALERFREAHRAP